jgi:hypothetical protein
MRFDSKTICGGVRSADRAAELPDQLLDVDRLRHEVRDAGAHRLDGVFERAERGRDQKRRAGARTFDAPIEIDAAHPGHAEVRDDGVRPKERREFRRARRVVGGFRFEALGVEQARVRRRRRGRAASLWPRPRGTTTGRCDS